MTKSSSYVLCFLLWLVLFSLTYFIALLFQASLWVTISSVIIASFGFLVFWRNRIDRHFPPAESPGEPTWQKQLIYLIGLSWIIYKTFPLQEKYGHWDAWWFWNLRADYLTRPDCWRQAFSGQLYGGVFTVPVAHADYPPFLPLIVGGLWRIAGTHSVSIPYALSIAAALIIPSVIYWEIYPRNKVIASLLLLVFVTNKLWAQLNTAQTADSWIAVFLLFSLLLTDAYRRTRQPVALFLLGATLGSLVWIKNEGIILSAAILLFYGRSLLHKKHVLQLLSGMALPLTALLFFKGSIAPPNDLVANAQGQLMDKITDLSRYTFIRQLTKDIIVDFYPLLPYLTGGYLIFCMADRRRPDKLFWLICFCFLCYLAAYVVTPHNLGWHISTSLDRLIIQLFPSLIWIVARRLTTLQFRIVK